MRFKVGDKGIILEIEGDEYRIRMYDGNIQFCNLFHADRFLVLLEKHKKVVKQFGIVKFLESIEK